MLPICKCEPRRILGNASPQQCTSLTSSKIKEKEQNMELFPECNKIINELASKNIFSIVYIRCSVYPIRFLGKFSSGRFDIMLVSHLPGRAPLDPFRHACCHGCEKTYMLTSQEICDRLALEFVNHLLVRAKSILALSMDAKSKCCARRRAH